MSKVKKFKQVKKVKEVKQAQGIANYICLVLIFALIICAGVWLYHKEENLRFNDNLKLLHDKADLLYAHIASGDVAEINAVFISLSDGKSRARV
ncbi:MAG: hypothetical protein IJ576_10395, partial [Synergistaceae bacterium]|nr:hypothetical protein [Synergistaceae bacterium]